MRFSGGDSDSRQEGPWMSALEAEQLFWLNIRRGEQGTKLLEHIELILLSGPEIKIIYNVF